MLYSVHTRRKKLQRCKRKVRQEENLIRKLFLQKGELEGGEGKGESGKGKKRG
jgi:hypothetical protein